MDIYAGQLVIFVMVFVRTVSMIVTAPVLGDETLPVQIKVALGVFVALVMYPLVAAQHPVVDLKLAGMAIMALKEVAVGVMLGFSAEIVLMAANVAGDLMSFDLGLTMASVLDPTSGQQNPVLTTLMRLMLVLVFLLVNGHHFVLQALCLSFEAVSLGSFSISGALSDHFISLIGSLFVLGIKLSAPIIVASFLVNVALGVLTRVAPQINVFILNFQLKIGIGFIILMAAAPMMVFVFKKILAGFEDNMLQLVRLM